jgi:bifunctional non-homologous end joining protein LigD
LPRADAPYVSRRDESWVKSKCEQRQEFVIIGYTAPQGSRTGFGALLLGYHDDKRRLGYAARVGTGFNVQLLKELHLRLRRMEVKTSPTATLPPARERRLARWVKPKLVAEIRFTGWTRDGMLLHPTFIALRSDKPAGEVVREVARAG